MLKEKGFDSWKNPLQDLIANAARHPQGEHWDVANLSLKTAEWSENSLTVLDARYRTENPHAGRKESVSEMYGRIAWTVSDGAHAPDMERRLNMALRFWMLMVSQKFLPNSPTQVNAGVEGKGGLSACFVVSPEDNLPSIMEVATEAAMIEKSGGGIGFNFSKLRPRKDRIATTHGEACGPIAVMKLYSQVGATLTQGAFRLGAHMATLDINHPDVREFIHCKDNDDTLQNFNVSVGVSGKFMKAAEDADDWDLVNPRNGEVVETVNARALWDEICESAWRTGDPGIIFVDAVDEAAPNPHLGKCWPNPCVTGDTLVHTGEGLKPIQALVGQTPLLGLDSRTGAERSMASRVFESGVKPVFRLVTKEGYSLKLTEDHEVFTVGGKVPASKLRKGDQIRLIDHKGHFGTEGNRDLGLVLGWLTGDGYITDQTACLDFYGDDRGIAEMMAEATQNVVAGTGERPWRRYPTGPVAVESRNLETVHSSRLKNILKEYGITKEDSRHVPQIVYEGTEEMQRAYLQALFGADGTVTGSGPTKGMGVRLSSSYPPLLEGVQRLLLNFGIASRIYHRRDERTSLLPDGKGGRGEYISKAKYEVVIGKDNVLRFRDEIGFLIERKNARLQDGINDYGSRGFYKERFVAKFDRMEPLGTEQVYDLTEPLTHSFVANGMVISNCAEQFLENHGSCNLGSLNLVKYVGDDGAFLWDQFENDIRTAIRFLDAVVEINEFPLDILRDVNLRTRRIGLGVMGWADVLIKMGIAYDSEEALVVADEIAAFMNKTAWSESVEMAAEIAPFPEWEDSALAIKGNSPRRNSCVLSVAPTGTISRIADCSSGIEPHFANAWWSNVLWTDHEGTSQRLLDAPSSVWEALRERLGSEDQVRAVLGRIADNPEDVERIYAENGIDGSVFRTSMAVSPEAHIRMQAAWQKHFTNGVSKTINLPNDATVEDIARSYILAFETGCKGVTVYRDGSKSMQVLETGKKDQETAPVPAPMTPLLPGFDQEPRERPSALLGLTEKVPTGHGTMYVTLNFDEDNKPFEMFTAIGKAGGGEPAHLEGLSRMISFILRCGHSPTQIIDQLNGITSEPVWHNGVLIRSAEDGIAHVLRKHGKGLNKPLD